jgi:3-dehydroquinate dehydratase / shikimate dehydrogenase
MENSAANIKSEIRDPKSQIRDSLVCVSVCAATADRLLEQIDRAAVLADVIEIRFDGLNEGEFGSFLKGFRRDKFSNLFLTTFRPAEQGGRKNLSLRERIEFWRYSNIFEFTDWADLEADISENEINELWGKVFKKVIKSNHDFQGVPENLDEIYEELWRETPEVVKIVVQAADLTDTIPVWKLLEKAKSENRPLIPIAMGEPGKWTRILGLAHGAFMTYAALEAGRETAPGQVSARDLREVYRAPELDETTEVYGILGSHVGISLSPHIHNAAFAHHRLNAVFVPLQLHDLDAFIRRMVKPETRELELNFRGFSVTHPHKQAIIEHLDFLDETARKIGAVNTVKLVDGKLYGFNTDAAGFLEPLLKFYGDLKDARVAILGAGGAARACVYALQAAGAIPTVFARDRSKAEPLAGEFGVELKELPKTDHREPKTVFADFDILVNTTPLGMKGKAEAETPATAEQLRGLRLVYDLVYTPFQTLLMTEADQAEVPKIGGLAMLVAQAVAQQRIWNGLEAPAEEMSRAALERLSGES